MSNAKKVLILGASGEIGGRIARGCVDAGYQATGVTRGTNTRHQVSLDGIEFITGDKYDEDFYASELATREFDVIIDSAGGDGFGDLARVLGPGGRLVFYGGTRGKWPQMLPQHLFYKQVSLLASTMGSPQEFQALLAFVAEHQIVPVVDRVFPMETGGEAFTYLDSGAQLGKVVVEIS